MPINAGTRVRLVVQGSTGEWVPRTPDDVKSNVINALSYYGMVQPFTLVKESSRFLAPLWDWRYTAALTLTTTFGHAKIEDIKAIVATAFHGAAGEPAIVAAIDYGDTTTPDVIDNTPDPTTALLGVGSFTVIAAVAVAVLVFKRG